VSAVLGAVVGLTAGAFVPLSAYRLAVPREMPVRAACEHCGAPLGWWGSRCRACGRALAVPWWVTALAGAVVCGGLGWRFGLGVALVPYLLLGALGVLLAVIDLACKRLPNMLVEPAIPAGAVLLAVADWTSLGRAALGAAALGGVYLVLWLLPGGGIGLGDVKLAVLLGLFLGWLGWGEVLAGALLPFLLHGPVALVLLIGGRVGRRSRLPFGPAMLAGAWLAIVGRHWLVGA
jgi:leader peptidase (prepilin peptidase) / N-methyltransferase